MDLNLSGKNALVCGSSRGIGRAIAIELSKMGCRVFCMARNKDSLLETLNLCEGEGHELIVGDLNDWQEVEKNILQVTQGKIDILINNSGGPKGGPIAKASPEEFLHAYQQHLIANSKLSQLFLEYMKDQAFGRIINIISTSVKTPLPGLGVSNTVRAAVASWGKTLSQEVASSGITVNSVLPGATKTERLDSLLNNWSANSGLSLEEETKKREAMIPAGRFGRPEEVAAAVGFLASPSAAYINGVALAVDGGRTACL